MIAISAAAEWYHEYDRSAEAANELLDLRAELKAGVREHVRRVDRFIQLALVGAARCVGSRELPAGCGVYLASGMGPVDSTAVVQEQMFRHGVLPKPAQFINTLANTAGFYIARNFGLDSQCLFISRGYASFEAALDLACEDLVSRRVPMALVGGVDQCTLPLNAHARRLHHPDAPVLAEGSQWLLLELSPTPQVRLCEVDNLLGHIALAQWLEAQSAEQGWCWQSAALDSEAARLVQAAVRRRHWNHWPGPVGESPLRSGSVAVRFARSGRGGDLMTINADRPGCYQVCRYYSDGGDA